MAKKDFKKEFSKELMYKKIMPSSADPDEFTDDVAPGSSDVDETVTATASPEASPEQGIPASPAQNRCGKP